MLPPVLLINPNGPYIGLPSYAYPNIGEWESFSDSTPLTCQKIYDLTNLKTTKNGINLQRKLTVSLDVSTMHRYCVLTLRNNNKSSYTMYVESNHCSSVIKTKGSNL